MQMCRQLFTEAHPPRLACPAAPDPSTLLPPPTNAATANTTGTALSLALLTTILAATASDETLTATSAEVCTLLHSAFPPFPAHICNDLVCVQKAHDCRQHRSKLMQHGCCCTYCLSLQHQVLHVKMSMPDFGVILGTSSALQIMFESLPV